MSSLAFLHNNSIISAAQFNRSALDELFALIKKIKQLDEEKHFINVLRGKIMVPLFFENSTRTFSSFCAAFSKLGGSVVYLGLESSSIAKGETLQDTARTVDQYADLIVMRHPQVEAIHTVKSVITHPIVNAGNGIGEHPSQSLLDAFTMHSELGRIDGLHIALLGDLKHGRTSHSLVKLLTNFKLGHLYFVAPESLQLPEDVLAIAREHNIPFSLHSALNNDILAQLDVLYVTRIQKERFATPEEYARVKGCYIIDANTLAVCKPAGQMIVMHPLPRVDEIAVEIDSDPRAAYFRQMRNGLHTRMALMSCVFEQESHIQNL